MVFVTNADREIGLVTVKALSSTYGYKMDIIAGVRNPDRAAYFNSLEGVTVVDTSIGHKEKLQETLKDVSALYLICPVSEERVQLTIDTAEAAKEAGVKHLLVLSSPTVDLPDTTFGKQFKQIETAVSSLGVPYTFLRLSLFIDNYYFSQTTIKYQSMFYGPVEPSKSYTPVAADDAASVAALILESPEKHAGKTYTIVSDRHTFGDVAKAFTEELGREVKYVRVPYEHTKASYIKRGLPEWQAQGIMQQYRLIDEGNSIMNRENLSDFSEITGKKPTTLSTWVMKNAEGFK